MAWLLASARPSTALSCGVEWVTRGRGGSGRGEVKEGLGDKREERTVGVIKILRVRAMAPVVVIWLCCCNGNVAQKGCAECTGRVLKGRVKSKEWMDSERMFT